VTDRIDARRTLVAAFVVLMMSMVATSWWPALAQSKKTTTTTTTEAPVTVPVAPGETAPNGGPLLVPGDANVASSSAVDTTNSDNTGTVVALVISGLLLVALMLALLTYWFWRNTRPGSPGERVNAEAASAEG
jgi:hypothetical protein